MKMYELKSLAKWVASMLTCNGNLCLLAYKTRQVPKVLTEQLHKCIETSLTRSRLAAARKVSGFSLFNNKKATHNTLTGEINVTEGRAALSVGSSPATLPGTGDEANV